MKTLKECQKEIAIKHKLGQSLVTGHRAAFFSEASELYAQQYKDLLTKEKESNSINPSSEIKQN